MGNPLPLFSAIAEGTYTPKRLAQGIDTNGNYVDANGQPTTYYDNPGFFQKALNPEARQVMQYNIDTAGQPLQQQRSRLLARQLAGQDWNTLTPQQQGLFGNNEQNAITTTGGNFTGNNLIGQGTSLAGINNGLPQASANAEYNNAIAQTQEAKNRADAAVTSGLLGNPSLGAGVENQQLGLQSGQLAGDTSLLPYVQRNRALSLSNDYQQEQLQKIIGNRQLELSPYTTSQMGNEATASLYQSQHPSLYASPFNATINNGDITLGRPPLEQAMQGQMIGALGRNAPISGPRGGIMPPRSNVINPLNNEFKTDEQGNLYRGGIPVEDGESHKGTFADTSSNTPKKQTTGQRLLQGIQPTIASGGTNPNLRSAQFGIAQGLRQKQADSARIQELTSILTNPPKHNAGKAGIVSTYNHDQLQSMADELDKLLGE